MNMQKQTGDKISGVEEIRQSVLDIITTPIGTRIMREDYGSLLPELIDQPLGEDMLLQCYAAIIMAVQQWEPRIRVNSVKSQYNSEQKDQQNRLNFVLNYSVLTQGQPQTQELNL